MWINLWHKTHKSICWGGIKNKFAFIILYNFLHSVRVQKYCYRYPARKIHILRGSRCSRLRGLSLTLNQVPQALLSIWASQNLKDQGKQIDRRTIYPLLECYLSNHHHEHSNEGEYSFTACQLHQVRLRQHLAWGSIPHVSSYFLTYLFTYIFLLWDMKQIKRCITFRKPINVSLSIYLCFLYDL
jgi:hypothetical protein